MSSKLGSLSTRCEKRSERCTQAVPHCWRYPDPAAAAALAASWAAWAAAAAAAAWAALHSLMHCGQLQKVPVISVHSFQPAPHMRVFPQVLHWCVCWPVIGMRAARFRSGSPASDACGPSSERFILQDGWRTCNTRWLGQLEPKWMNHISCTQLDH